MNPRRRGPQAIKVGLVFLALGLARFAWSAWKAAATPEPRCFWSETILCDLTLPDYSPTLAQIGGACVVAGVALWLFGAMRGA
jgi:hypothetical protein